VIWVQEVAGTNFLSNMAAISGGAAIFVTAGRPKNQWCASILRDIDLKLSGIVA